MPIPRLVKVALAAIPLAAVALPARAATLREHVSIVASDRFRIESVDWFRPPLSSGARNAAQRYDFMGNQLRFGLRVTIPNAQLLVEGQDTRLLNLPDDASLAAPFGNLGPGANYFAHTRERAHGETILRQAVLTVRAYGANAALGRFEQADGLEALPGDADLLWLKRARLAERLLGPFGYTHVGRAVDGLKLWVDQPAWNATALGVRPTAGGFEVSGGEPLDEITLLGASVTAKRLLDPLPTDARAFWFRYEDERVEDGVPVRVDNRPAPVRAADREAIRLDTFGGHAATVMDVGGGRLDALAWGAWQRGDWGAQTHRAWSAALEAGWQWPRLPFGPWLRAGWNAASGDDDPADARHGTFVPLLPTPRIYALLPFYNGMNLEDRFVQLIARPTPLVTLRADVHVLRLESSADLWYSGGGAIRQDLFGFGGAPAAGRRALARVIDGSVTYTPVRRLTFHAYYGQADGDDVIEGIFAGSDASYGYLETTVRW